MGKWKQDYNLNRRYNPEWQKDRMWLQCTEDGKCYCTVCRSKFKPKKSILSQHEKTLKHIKALDHSEIEYKFDPEKSQMHFINIETKPNLNGEDAEHANCTIELSERTQSKISKAEEKSPLTNEPKVTEVHEEVIESVEECSSSNQCLEDIPVAVSLEDKKPFSIQFPASNIKNFTALKSGKILKKVQTPSGCFLLYEPNRDEFETLIQNVMGNFKKDLETFLVKNETISKSIKNNPDFSSGKGGLDRLTRYLVGHMAHQYLMEYTVDSWKQCTRPNTSDMMANKLDAIEQTMERSVLEMKYLKEQLKSNEEFSQSAITLENVNIDL